MFGSSAWVAIEQPPPICVEQLNYECMRDLCHYVRRNGGKRGGDVLRLNRFDAYEPVIARFRTSDSAEWGEFDELLACPRSDGWSPVQSSDGNGRHLPACAGDDRRVLGIPARCRDRTTAGREVISSTHYSQVSWCNPSGNPGVGVNPLQTSNAVSAPESPPGGGPTSSRALRTAVGVYPGFSPFTDWSYSGNFPESKLLPWSRLDSVMQYGLRDDAAAPLPVGGTDRGRGESQQVGKMVNRPFRPVFPAGGAVVVIEPCKLESHRR